MREMSASEASRNFAAVLDEAERGETVVVTRSGRQVATIAPAPRGNGRALRQVLEHWQGRAGVDADFAETVAGVRESLDADQDADPWHV